MYLCFAAVSTKNKKIVELSFQIVLDSGYVIIATSRAEKLIRFYSNYSFRRASCAPFRVYEPSNAQFM